MRKSILLVVALVLMVVLTACDSTSATPTAVPTTAPTAAAPTTAPVTAPTATTQQVSAATQTPVASTGQATSTTKGNKPAVAKTNRLPATAVPTPGTFLGAGSTTSMKHQIGLEWSGRCRKDPHQSLSQALGNRRAD